MNSFGSVLAMGCILAFAIGCASSGPPEKGIDHPNPVVPEWVSSPYIEGGMAATQCVGDVAPMSILKGQASALARASLASQLQVAVDDLKVNYQESRQDEAGATFSQEYDRVTRNLATQTMVGSREARADYVAIRSADQFCVMVIIDKKHATVMRDKLFSQAATETSPEDEKVMWEAFLKKSTMESLEAERAKRS